MVCVGAYAPIRLAFLSGEKNNEQVNFQNTYRSAVAVMGGKYMIGFSPEHRKAAGVQGGDETDDTLELDVEPRTVEIPEDLKDALTKANLLNAFEKTAPSMKKEYVRQVEEAKAQETRERRINKIVEKLSAA